MEEIGKRRHSSTAMFLLFAEGCVLLHLGAAILTCGFVLDMENKYDVDAIDSKVDYTQYWVGFFFLITAFFAAAVAVRQRNRTLILFVLVLFILCILVSLFALVVEGNDWVRYSTARRRKSFWEDEDYKCSSNGSTCSCMKGNLEPITMDLDCDLLNKVTNLYGGIVCCVLVGVFVALSSIIIILVWIPIKTFTLPQPAEKIRNVTVLEEKPQTPPSPRVIYERQRPPEPEVQNVVMRQVSRKPQPQPQPQVIVREVERPPPRPQVIVREVERPPPKPQVIVREVERPPPKPQVIVREVERPPPKPQVIVRKVERPPPKPQVIVRHVERPPPKPQVIVREVERPPPKPQVIVREVERPPPKPQVIVREVERPPPPRQVIIREVERPPPPQPQVVVQRVERPSRRQPVVYDDPRRSMKAIEPIPVKQYERRPTQKMISQVYDEGRSVKPQEPSTRNFVRNPNFVPKNSRENPLYVDDAVELVPVKRKSRERSARYVVENAPRRERSRVRSRARSADRRPTSTQVVVHQRPRAYSDERPRVIYTQKSQASARPRVYTNQQVANMNGEAMQPRQQDYGGNVDDNLESAANWDIRPPTPY